MQKSRRSKGAAGLRLLPNYSQESKRSEQMYDFYFSDYFAYYICKVKERKIKTRKKFLFFKLFSILIV